MILDKNWKFPLCFIFNKISLEIKSNDHLVRKQAPPPNPHRLKKWILHSCHIGIFPRG